jgi:phosphate-selective porin
VRYDFADLTEVGRSATGAEALGAAGKAGVYQGLTLGAVWRPEPGYRLLLNLSQARVTSAPLQADVTLRLLQIRAQYDF